MYSQRVVKTSWQKFPRHVAYRIWARQQADTLGELEALKQTIRIISSQDKSAVMSKDDYRAAHSPDELQDATDATRQGVMQA